MTQDAELGQAIHVIADGPIKSKKQNPTSKKKFKKSHEMTIDTCWKHIYTELVDGSCPDCDLENTTQSRFQYLVERLYSTAFKAGLTPMDRTRMKEREEALQELMELKHLFRIGS